MALLFHREQRSKISLSGMGERCFLFILHDSSFSLSLRRPAVGRIDWLNGWAKYLPLLCSPQPLPRVRRSINGNVSITRISIALCVGYGGALISARIDDNPLVSGIDRPNDNKWFLPAKLFNSDLSRKQNVSGIDVSPVIQVIATCNVLPSEEIHVARAEKNCTHQQRHQSRTHHLTRIRRQLAAYFQTQLERKARATHRGLRDRARDGWESSSFDWRDRNSRR
jgi:hypothetical protein